MRRRMILLGSLLVTAAVIYAVVFGIVYNIKLPGEQTYAEAGTAAPLDIYVTMAEMDPVRDELLVRLDFATVNGPQGAHYAGVPERDLIVQVGDGNFVQDVVLQAGRSAAPVTLGLSLRGHVYNYPLDAYDGRLSVSATETASGAIQPVKLTVWPVMSNWMVKVGRTGLLPDASSGVALNLHISRPVPFIVIAIAIYAAMALVGLSGLTIGALVFLGIRRIEATLTSTLGAMVFAVPALRTALPGVPPLGGHADVLVFVWVELAVILGLTLFVFTWARRGPAP